MWAGVTRVVRPQPLCPLLNRAAVSPAVVVRSMRRRDISDRWKSASYAKAKSQTAQLVAGCDDSRSGVKNLVADGEPAK
jgi:hypothetical protein